ncbi:MAG: class I SAM-dependent methyltransferase [Nostocaceae cyanobacterium]|nr:class I SAM-dependent methyltransferase [Nostocaceae cyanobacterium]
MFVNNQETAEQIVQKFYTSGGGWAVDENGIAHDTHIFEDLRECVQEYASATRLRVLNYLPASGENIIDAASGPVQYPEYRQYSQNFAKRYCVDISDDALALARKNIGDRGEFLNARIQEINLPDNFFDAGISLHTIYHIDKNEQELAVRNLLRMVKPGQPLVVIYHNPRSIFSLFGLLPAGKNIIKKIIGYKTKNSLYFFNHNLGWWQRFSDSAKVEMFPWRMMEIHDMKRFIPNNGLGKKMLSILYGLENRFPNLFVRIGRYPIMVLTKK